MSCTNGDERIERRNNYYREKYGVEYGDYDAIIDRLEAENAKLRKACNAALQAFYASSEIEGFTAEELQRRCDGLGPEAFDPFGRIRAVIKLRVVLGKPEEETP